MFQVRSDETKNLLEAHFSGTVNPDEARQCAEEVQALLPRLQTGFTMLTDLTGMKSMNPKCVPSIEAIMDACRKAGISRVIRIIPDPHKDIGLTIISLFHYPRKVRIVTCETRAEADKLLTE